MGHHTGGSVEAGLPSSSMGSSPLAVEEPFAVVLLTAWGETKGPVDLQDEHRNQ
jgi:hypothetical protein